MLKPAQLYKEELNRKYIETWYDPKYMYYACGTSRRALNIHEDNSDVREFACVGKNNDVTGYLGYTIDWTAKSAYSFHLMSFIDGNTALIRDVVRHITYLFEDVGINRVEFWAFKENPANRGYEKFIKRYGGHKAGELHKYDMLIDGKLHDMVIYEILRKDGEEND